MNAKVKWLVGCSGFSYKDWRPIFYPGGLGRCKWLKYYSAHFNTMESNVTFYRTPQPKTFQKWFSDTPDDFYFSVKAPRTITHFKRMVGIKEILTAFYDLIAGTASPLLAPRGGVPKRLSEGRGGPPPHEIKASHFISCAPSMAGGDLFISTLY
jgi:hypothetical protein